MGRSQRRRSEQVTWTLSCLSTLGLCLAGDAGHRWPRARVGVLTSPVFSLAV